MTTTNESAVSSQAASTCQLAWLLVGDVADILDDGIDTENLRWLLPVLESLLNLMNSEEKQDGAGGYLDDVLELSPNSFEQVEGLHTLRSELRADLNRIIHAEDILARFPDLPRKDRETRILQDHPAVFIYGIGTRRIVSPKDTSWQDSEAGGRNGKTPHRVADQYSAYGAHCGRRDGTLALRARKTIDRPQGLCRKGNMPRSNHSFATTSSLGGTSNLRRNAHGDRF